MKPLAICLILLSSSCDCSYDLIGDWNRVEYSIGDNVVHQIISKEIGIPLGHDLKLKIDKDSLHLLQEDIKRVVEYQVDQDLLLFPDKEGLAIYWKIKECSSNELLIERSIGGFDPVWEKLKFERE